MDKKKDPVFEEYEDLYKLTNKTADEHIKFYKTRKTKTDEDLWEIYTNLSVQSKKFENIDWIDKWHNWSKNINGFQNHCMEAKFLIENYLRDILEEILIRRIDQYKELHDKYVSVLQTVPSQSNESLSKMIKKEIKKALKEELAAKKRKSKK